MAKVTIEDISRYTELSRGTVSRALNDRPDISEATKQRVLEACRVLNYSPSQVARSLATGRNYAAAVVVRDVTAPFEAALLSGVLAQAEKARYAVQVLELGNDQASITRRWQGLSAERIDGVILASPPNRSFAAAVDLSQLDQRVVACWAHPGLAADVITIDAAAAGALVARFLSERQVSGWLHLRGDSTLDADARAAGFVATMNELGCGGAGRTFVAAEEHWSAGAEGNALRGALRTASAVVCESDELAVRASFELAAMGRRPGIDVALIGFGNTPTSGAIRPSLTSIDPCAAEIGRRALSVLLQRVQSGRADSPSTTAIAPRLVERESTRNLDLAGVR